MKILQVIHSFPPYHTAGSEVYTYNLSQELAKRHKVFVFHRINDPHKKEYELTNSSSNGLSIYTINNTFRHCDSFKMTYRNKFIDDKFSDLLDEIKPDIAHIQHLLFLSTALIEEIKKRKIPILFTLHDYWLICQQGQLLKRGSNICENQGYSECVDCLFYLLSLRKGVMRTYQILREIMSDILLQLIKKTYFYYAKATFLSPSEALGQIKVRTEHIKEICDMVDLFVSPSQFLRRKFIEFGISQSKIIFIQNGLDKRLFRDFQRSKSEKIRFGYIGTLLPAKGAHILIEAFNRIKDNNAELKIYGNPLPYKGFEYYPRYIQRLAKNRNIRFMGSFDHEDVTKIFSEIDILVVPSIWNENLPSVILEAFSTKTPVIASRIGGIPELIKDKENGLLLEPDNPDDLYDKMKIFINHPDSIERLKLGINLPKSIEENGREIEELYKDLLNGKWI